MNSREKLEFRELLGQLGRFVISPAGRERLSYLGPKNSILEIERALERVREMASLLDKGVFFDFSGIPDLSSIIAKARTGAFLTPSELYSLSLFIEKVHEIYQKLMGTALEEVLADPYILLGLMREIRSKIDEEGEVVDTASEALYKIRSERRKKRREIIALMEGLLDRYDRKGLLRDRVITIKNGRMVLPFKSHVRIKGVVHGFSNTEETVYIEPFEVIEAQNRLVRVEEEEREEVERILRELAEKVSGSAGFIGELYGQIGEVEVIYASAQFMREVDGTIPRINRDGRIYLKKARHPLLLKSLGEDRVVPLDFRMDGDLEVFLISGPNAGGKTVVLKTVGLLTLMAASGLPVPAQEADLFIPGEIYAIGFEDEQDILRGESSFTAILSDIKELLEKGEKGDLALLDEFLASTDPTEGAALAFAVLKYLVDRGIKVIANTHLNPLKTLVSREPSMENATMEFDPVTRTPTYRLIPGEIGYSHALDIARRTGFPPELLSEAEGLIEGIEGELKRHIEELRKAEEEYSRKLREIEEREEKLREKEESFEKRAKLKARAIVDRAMKEVEVLLEEIRKEKKLEEKLKKAKKTREVLKQKKEEFDIYGEPAKEIVPGRLYRVKPLGFVGELVEIKEGSVVLKVGRQKVEVKEGTLFEVK